MKIGDRIYVRGYIDEIRKDTVIVRNDGGYFGTVLSEVTGELPSAQPEPRWIPCSERLPEEDGLYLVTSREKATAEEFGFDLDDVEVRKMRFNEDGWRIPKHIPEWINGVVHTTVLAWMPLPEPYKEEQE